MAIFRSVYFAALILALIGIALASPVSELAVNRNIERAFAKVKLPTGNIGDYGLDLRDLRVLTQKPSEAKPANAVSERAFVNAKIATGKLGDSQWNPFHNSIIFIPRAGDKKVEPEVVSARAFVNADIATGKLGDKTVEHEDVSTRAFAHAAVATGKIDSRTPTPDHDASACK
ncbi:hypothetical protein BDZ97DRAFT_1923140 [Flammula alnicola]|nr:hypothetical protein BDZ97DRAFT_1923140 [Flammula alnicola]